MSEDHTQPDIYGLLAETETTRALTTVRGLVQSLDDDLRRATDAQYTRQLVRLRLGAILTACEPITTPPTTAPTTTEKEH